ncbi:hypothetical protein JW859_03500, partial [bacterium]|nr:hypothetical protein [bacterium]
TSSSYYYCYGGFVGAAGSTPLLAGRKYNAIGNWSDYGSTSTGTYSSVATKGLMTSIASSATTMAGGTSTTTPTGGVIDTGAGSYDFFVSKGYYGYTP